MNIKYQTIYYYNSITSFSYISKLIIAQFCLESRIEINETS